VASLELQSLKTANMLVDPLARVSDPRVSDPRVSDPRVSDPRVSDPYFERHKHRIVSSWGDLGEKLWEANGFGKKSVVKELVTEMRLVL